MERFLGWRGLLIEADPSNYELMMKKRRHAWAAHVCLSGNTVSEVSEAVSRFAPEVRGPAVVMSFTTP